MQVSKALVTTVAAGADLVKAHAELAMAVAKGEPEKAMKAAVAATRAETNMAIDNEVVRANKPLLSLPISVLPGLCETEMEKPDPPPGGVSGGQMVYYVNGMDTSKERAEAEARALSKQIGCPVWLIYNDTHGWGSDLVEAAYDRAWPLPSSTSGFRLAGKQNHTPSGAFAVPTCRGGSLIRLHSQGCLIVRNALLMANSFSGGRTKDMVTWVATGMPFARRRNLPRGRIGSARSRIRMTWSARPWGFNSIPTASRHENSRSCTTSWGPT